MLRKFSVVTTDGSAQVEAEVAPDQPNLNGWWPILTEGISMSLAVAHIIGFAEIFPDMELDA